MNSGQRRTIQRLFGQPTPNDFPWSDIVSLFRHLDLEVKYGMGSRVKFARGEEVHHCHRPHPSKQTPSITAKGIRDFLKEIGVEP
jgi:hypothetical protein